MTGVEIFGPDGQLTWWQECDRAVVVFFYGLALVRLGGRRVFGKWAALDIVVSIIVGSNLSRALTGSASVGGTLAATTVLMAMHWVLAQIAARSDWLARIVEGTPLALARDGAMHRSTSLRDAVSRNDIEEALRQAGVERVADTRLITVEPSGKITVLKAR